VTVRICPLCEKQSPEPTERCAVCDGDLRPLLRLADLADWHFNQAVVAARAEDWTIAADHLAVTLSLNSDDVDGLVLLGKVRYHQQQHRLARQAWEQAHRIAPDRPDITAALAAVNGGQTLLSADDVALSRPPSRRRWWPAVNTRFLRLPAHGHWWRKQ
jgi:tetratricopeptide (TPR) repeat protein